MKKELFRSELIEIIEQKENRIIKAVESIQRARSHLASSKFFEDTTIQIKDVDNILINLIDDLRGPA